MAEITAKSEQEFISSHIGKVLPVLFETPENGVFSGYTDNYIKVNVKSDEMLSGEIRNVRLVKSSGDCAEGVLV